MGLGEMYQKEVKRGEDMDQGVAMLPKDGEKKEQVDSKKATKQQRPWYPDF